MWSRSLFSYSTLASFITKLRMLSSRCILIFAFMPMDRQSMDQFAEVFPNFLSFLPFQNLTTVENFHSVQGLCQKREVSISSCLLVNCSQLCSLYELYCMSCRFHSRILVLVCVSWSFESIVWNLLILIHCPVFVNILGVLNQVFL